MLLLLSYNVEFTRFMCKLNTEEKVQLILTARRIRQHNDLKHNRILFH